ncbi:tyrosine-type recombinase/integrase [Haloprofundus salilacus]|uniref:tyrosine-type recombinase/integrase n=1 Tax=Haloprofundus salilacus TaxID=2876190 RepID=UPI001CCE888F|nr:tyrosine-type recombinase/integrase [Haloprofundus salilacus]
MHQESDPATIESAIERYLDGVEAGNSRKNYRSVLAGWAAWLRDEADVASLNGLTVMHCRRYARHLKELVRESELRASTANTYYAYVRAFLGFCVADELLDVNPAKSARATDELPEDHGDRERQFWRRKQRNAILTYVDRRAEEAQETGSEREIRRALRDRALVALLALSGVRGGEAFAAAADDRRSGLTWNDVDTDANAVRVFGKSREYEYAQLPERASAALVDHREYCKPADASWPVFPTGHGPSLRQAIEMQLGARGWTDEEIDARCEKAPLSHVVREERVTPPSLTTNGARSVMKRLCADADIDVRGEYLKPHGARRGLGHELYASGHAELAQSALRHASIETTHESYSDIRAAETARRVDRVLERDGA